MVIFPGYGEDFKKLHIQGALNSTWYIGKGKKMDFYCSTMLSKQILIKI